eukprot:g50062.t1
MCKDFIAECVQRHVINYNYNSLRVLPSRKLSPGFYYHECHLVNYCKTQLDQTDAPAVLLWTGTVSRVRVPVSDCATWAAILSALQSNFTEVGPGSEKKPLSNRLGYKETVARLARHDATPNCCNTKLSLNSVSDRST